MIPIDTIVVPQGAEYQAVCRGLKKADCNDVSLVSIPIGTKNMEQTLANYSGELTKAKNILIMGLCGSLSNKYTVRDIALYESCGNAANQQVDLRSKLTTIIQKKLSIDLVAGITSDRVIYQAEEKLKLSQTYPVSVVDMEGYGYVKEFQTRKITVSMVRVVSDDTTGDIPDLSVAIDADGNFKTIPMAIAFLKQPIAATRLIKGSLLGLKTLQQVTQQLFGSG